jgi:tRNA(Arg) A34 adenosine deaminase TadA
MDPMRFPRFTLALPDWIESVAGDPGRVFETVEERMEFVMELARWNVRNGMGGPFGAAVFDYQTGRLVAPGVNLVVPACCSVAHAEIVAITIAQQVGHRFDLGAENGSSFELVTSTEPCAMCLGAVTWSGIRRLICGARREDAIEIGFDEGPRSDDWVHQLEARGVTVLQDIHRHQAAAVLRQYAERGGLIYNGQQGGIPKTDTG